MDAIVEVACMLLAIVILLVANIFTPGSMTTALATQLNVAAVALLVMVVAFELNRIGAEVSAFLKKYADKLDGK